MFLFELIEHLECTHLSNNIAAVQGLKGMFMGGILHLLVNATRTTKIIWQFTNMVKGCQAAVILSNLFS